MVANVKVIKKIECCVDRRNGGVLNRLLRVTAYARASTMMKIREIVINHS